MLSGEDVFQACMTDSIAFMPFFPLAVGRLGQEGSAEAAIAATHGATPGQVALAWLLARAPTTIVIPGTASLAHLEENIAAATLRLSDAERAELDAMPNE